MKRLKPAERPRAAKRLIESAFEVAKLIRDDDDGDCVARPQLEPDLCVPTPAKMRKLFLEKLFSGGLEANTLVTQRESDESLWNRCESEISLYRGATTSVPRCVGPLAWWEANRSRFPTLAVLARKWLGCIATSVPSERAFSTSGNTVTDKRYSLSPTTVRDVVFVSTNC
jgi:hypothetical protein